MENVLGNESLPLDLHLDAPSYSLSVIVFLSIAAIIGAVENATICIVACKFTHMRTVPNYLTVSMVLSNLLICTVTIPLDIFLQVYSDACLKISCDFLMSFNIFITLVSLWTLCPILLDRHFIVRIPLIYMKKRNVPLAVTLIVISWVAPFILVLLYTLTKEDSFHDREVMTGLASWENFAGLRYFVLCMCVGMGLPLLVCFVLNIAILEVVLKRRKRQMQLMPLRLQLQSPGTKRRDSKMSCPTPHHERASTIRKNTVSCGVSCTMSQVSESNVGCQETTGLPRILLPVISELKSPQDRTKRQRPSKSVCVQANSHPLKLIRLRSFSRINLQGSLSIDTTGNQSSGDQDHNLNRRVFSLHREKKTFFVMVLILGTLAGSCLPLFVLECYLVRYPEERHVNQYMSKSLWWLNWSSCALNPILYTIFRKEFRDAFRKLIRR